MIIKVQNRKKYFEIRFMMELGINLESEQFKKEYKMSEDRLSLVYRDSYENGRDLLYRFIIGYEKLMIGKLCG